MNARLFNILKFLAENPTAFPAFSNMIIELGCSPQVFEMIERRHAIVMAEAEATATVPTISI
jgi:hypothetical protein